METTRRQLLVGSVGAVVTSAVVGAALPATATFKHEEYSLGFTIKKDAAHIHIWDRDVCLICDMTAQEVAEKGKSGG
jgi:hypothetical protein